MRPERLAGGLHWEGNAFSLSKEGGFRASFFVFSGSILERFFYWEARLNTSTVGVVKPTPSRIMKTISAIFTGLYRVSLVAAIGFLGFSIYNATQTFRDPSALAEQGGKAAAKGGWDGMVDNFKRLVKYDIGRETTKGVTNVGDTIVKGADDVAREGHKVVYNTGKTFEKAGQDAKREINNVTKHLGFKL